MKKWIWIFLIGVACDQQMYDMIYRAIIQEALNSKLPEAKVIKTKNDSIEHLRKLCKGQVSSFELDYPTSTRTDLLFRGKKDQ